MIELTKEQKDIRRAAQEFARIDGGIAQSMVGAYFGIKLIQLFGTEDQKQKYLPPVWAGQLLGGMASTEPDAGSDVARISTTDVKDGDEYVISGNMMLSTIGVTQRYLRSLKGPKR